MLEIIHELSDILVYHPSSLFCDISISLVLRGETRYPYVDIAVKTRYDDGDCIEVGAIPTTGVNDMILEEFGIDQVKEACNRFRELFHTHIVKS
jgi:hypothetical protein